MKLSYRTFSVFQRPSTLPFYIVRQNCHRRTSPNHLTSKSENSDFQFLSEDDTGIPGLSEYCQMVARADRNDMVTGMLTSLDKLGRQMSALAMSLKDASENVTMARASVEAYVKDHSSSSRHS